MVDPKTGKILKAPLQAAVRANSIDVVDQLIAAKVSVDKALESAIKQDNLVLVRKLIQNGKATNGSQFFITYEAASRLDGLNEDDSKKDCTVSGTSCHSVFGKVTQGMDVLRGLAVPSQGMTPDVIDKILIYSE